MCSIGVYLAEVRFRLLYFHCVVPDTCVRDTEARRSPRAGDAVDGELSFRGWVRVWAE